MWGWFKKAIKTIAKPITSTVSRVVGALGNATGNLLGKIWKPLGDAYKGALGWTARAVSNAAKAVTGGALDLESWHHEGPGGYLGDVVDWYTGLIDKNAVNVAIAGATGNITDVASALAVVDPEIASVASLGSQAYGAADALVSGRMSFGDLIPGAVRKVTGKGKGQ